MGCPTRSSSSSGFMKVGFVWNCLLNAEFHTFASPAHTTSTASPSTSNAIVLPICPGSRPDASAACSTVAVITSYVMIFSSRP